MKVLLAVTTFNKLDITKRSMEYLMDLPHDIIVIDDCSTDGTQEYLAQIKVESYCKTERRGLTDSWNWAYRYFKCATEYSYMVLMNNDVIVPQGAIENMLSDYPLTVPMTTYEGAGYRAKGQAIDFHVNVRDYDPGQSKNAQKIQNLCSKKFVDVHSWTGFMMCFSRKIIHYEEDGDLFDVNCVNVGNDDDLASRVRAKLAVGSFVFHYKGASFNKQIAGRDDLSRNY